jgi:tRNA (mo5U34)-methyltransferase
MDRDRLVKEMHSHNWMHTIDLGNGVVTPGKWPVNSRILMAFQEIDFSGKKVLDVGTCNGLWSFEAEKRGASEVYSIDYLTHVNYWCSPAFKFAHKVLGSKALYYPDLNVYDVEQLGINDFDVVIFCGVYYYLKNPLLALSKLRKIMRTGGVIIIEGSIYSDDKDCYATYHYKNILNHDKSNWWVPSLRCLREWVESSFFDIRKEWVSEGNGSSFRRVKDMMKRVMGKYDRRVDRIVMIAEAVRRHDGMYRSPDPDLLEFFAEES